MKPIRVPPTCIDREIAGRVVEHAQPFREKTAEGLTWGADEHVLIAAAMTNWIVSRQDDRHARIAGNHLLAAAVVTGALRHILKLFSTSVVRTGSSLSATCMEFRSPVVPCCSHDAALP